MPAKDIVTNLQNSINKSKDTLIDFYNYLQTYEKTINSIKNTSMGFVDGSATFLGNVPNIINNTKDFNIIKNSLKVNFLFLLPIFAYYNISRFCFSLLAKNNETNNDFIFTDYIFYTAYLKYIIEYYFENIFLFTATSWLPLVETDNQVLEKCRDKAKFDNKSLIIKPINLLVEQGIIMYAQNQSILKVLHYALFSLYNGRCLVKNKINKENTCEIHQNEFLSKHTFYIAGLGASYIFITNYLYSSVSEKTGFHNFFLYDAIASFVYQVFLTNSNYSKWNFKADSFNIEFYEDLELITSTLYDKYGKKIESGVEALSKRTWNQISKIKADSKSNLYNKIINNLIISNNLSSLENMSRIRSLQLLVHYNSESIHKSLKLIINAKELLEKTGDCELYILSMLLNFSCPNMLAKFIYFLVEKGYLSVDNTNKTINFIDIVVSNYQSKEYDVIQNNEVDSDTDILEEQDGSPSWINLNKKNI